MSRYLTYLRSRRFPALLAAGLLVFGLWQLLTPTAYGNPLGLRSLLLNNSIVSGQSGFQLAFELSTPGPLGSIRAEFCSNSPALYDPCVVPSGLSLSGLQLTNQSGELGFSLANSGAPNVFIMTRPVLPSTVGPVKYVFADAVNPNQAGTVYVRLQTFATSNASGPSSDYGSIAIAFNSNVSISAEVPPYLIFCAAISIPTYTCDSATGNYINFGEFSPNRPSFGTSQILSSTNARDGYNITLAGTTLTSGNNAITALLAADVSRPGTPQFGLNLRANASPSGGGEPSGAGAGAPKGSYALANFYQFQQGDIVASVPKPDLTRRYTASYLVNVPKIQAPGIYVSTVTYICLGNF